jgi:putative hemolysin
MPVTKASHLASNLRPAEKDDDMTGNPVSAAMDRPFALDLPQLDGLAATAWGLARGAVEHLLDFPRLNELYSTAATADDIDGFLDRVVQTLAIEQVLDPADLNRIPKTGPVVVVANHPLGAIDGILLARLLRSVRRDVRLMGNYHLARLSAIKEMFLLVDPFAREGSASFNRRGVKQTLDHLKAGGCLGVFPAGEVAHLHLRQRGIVESPWSESVTRLIRKTGATVVPVHFSGRNSAAFQLLGLIHPRLRTFMLPRQVFKQYGATVEIRIGRPINPRTIADMGAAAAVTAYLRLRTCMLEHRGEKRHSHSTGFQPVSNGAQPAQIVTAVKPTLLQRDIDSLLTEQLLVESDDLVVYHAKSSQIPHLLQEIGRLREITFRAVGEGSGKAIDLDEFDAYYTHLFIWNRTKGELVGAYRLGQTDEIVRKHGVRGLYTATLFDFDPLLFAQFGPSLEMGRSFVRAEYQKGYLPLLMLWKGIGHFVVKHPRYRNLFGPVSITNEYQSLSKQLMVKFLKLHATDADAGRYVHPRTPFVDLPVRDWTLAAGQAVRGIDDVNTLVGDLEPDGKGVPILLKQYLKLGGRLLGFNIDPDFSNVLDGLIMVDLATAEPRSLARYMGEAGLAKFRALHSA